MIHTMNRNRPLVWASLMLLALVGCTETHEHEAIGKDSPEFKAVQKMVDSLRLHGVDEAMETSAAKGLKPERIEALTATLQTLYDAETIELEAVDQFGPETFRATFLLNETKTFAVLLVRPEGEEFCWVGMN
jgi:hypothetical protein